MLRILAILTYFAVSVPVWAAEAKPFVLEGPLEGQYLGRFMDICPGAQEDFRNLQNCERRDVDIALLELGEGKYWFRLIVENRLTATLPIVIENNWPTDYLRVVQVEGGAVIGDTEFGNVIYRKPSILHRYAAQRIEVEPGQQTIYIQMQHTGSVRLPLRIWNEESFQHNKYREDIAAGLLVGVTLSMMLYNLFLFITFRFKQQIFYVGFLIATCWYLVFWSGLSLSFAQPIRDLFNWTWIGSASLMCVFLCHFTLLFLDFRNKSRVFTWIFQFFAWTFGFAAVLDLFSRKYSFILFSLMLSPYMIACFAAGCRGVWSRGRPATFYLLSFTLVLFGGSLENLIAMGVIDPKWSFWPFFTASNLQSILLSLAMGDKLYLDQKSAHNKIVELNSDLTKHVLHVNDLVDEKTREIRSIMTNIPQGILMIQADQTIHRDHSAYCCLLFEKETLEGLPVLDLVFHQTDIGADRLAQLRAALDVCLGEPEIAFTLNVDCFPIECRRADQILEMNWHPILTPDGRIERILLSVRDVSSLRSLQHHSENQTHRLALIGEIIGTDQGSFLRFLRASRGFQLENLRLIDKLVTHDPEVQKILFINLHTMKGIARSLHLTKMAELCHQVEQHLADVQDGRRAFAKADLEQELSLLTALLDVYESVSRRDLGRTMQMDEHTVIAMKDLEPLVKRLDQLDRSNRAELENVTAEIHNFLTGLYYQAPERIFTDIFASLPRLARDLGKEEPRIQLDIGPVLITREAEDLFRHILVHLLRNSMDHGIENRDERHSQGKPSQGLIRVALKPHKNGMEVTYSDDGRGLNLKAIRATAVKRGLWDGRRPIPISELASYIFTSGFTTSQTVSDISGRGVGMDAVSHYILDHGGTIALQLPANADSNADFSPFHFVIHLPMRFFRDIQEAA